MTAKEFVKSHYPRANKERHVGNDRKPYYLIRIGRESMWFASGDTESKAWVEAKKRIEVQLKAADDKAYQDLLLRTNTKIDDIYAGYQKGGVKMDDYVRETRNAIGTYLVICDDKGWTDKQEYSELKGREWILGGM